MHINSLLQMMNITQTTGKVGDDFECEYNHQIQIEKCKVTPEEKAEGFAMRQGMFLGKKFDVYEIPTAMCNSTYSKPSLP